MAVVTSKKELSREKILESAGCLLREKGISGTSVAGAMGGAGMTVGGFYAHFPSKQGLIAETLRKTLRESRSALVASVGDKSGAEWVQAVADSYLSRFHRDNPRVGCPLPASAGEIASADLEVREVLAEEIEDYAMSVSAHIEEDGSEASRDEALAAISLMIGGLTLARATEGTELSDEVLKACRNHIANCLESGV